MKTIKLIGIIALTINMVACGRTTKDKTGTIEAWELLADDNYTINYSDSWELNKSE